MKYALAQLIATLCQVSDALREDAAHADGETAEILRAAANTAAVQAARWQTFGELNWASAQARRGPRVIHNRPAPEKP